MAKIAVGYQTEYFNKTKIMNKLKQLKFQYYIAFRDCTKLRHTEKGRNI